MREDMPKKFLEPSSGKRGKFPRNSKKYRPDKDGETPIPVEGMRKVHSIIDPDDTKYTGTNFSFLRRVLRSHCGRPWNEVYKEICEHADYRSHQGHHLLEWLSYEVEQNCTIKDGVIYDPRGLKISSLWRNEFYVHPETGNLEYSGDYRRYRRQEQEKTVFEMDDILYHKHNDVWYRVKFKPYPEPDKSSFSPLIVDVFVSVSWTSYYSSTRRSLNEKYGPGEDGARYCCWKQSANGNEIEKLKKKYPDIS